jgi:hypothetical protein
MRLKTNDIEATTIDGAAKEIEENHMDFVNQYMQENNIAIGDALEAIATHIVMDDTDCVVDSENEKYEIEIAVDTDEGPAFCDYLNAQGHTAKIGTSTGNYINKMWTNADIEANKIMRELWSEYCSA